MVGREFLGREWLYQVETGAQRLRLRLRLPLECELEPGQRCRLLLRSESSALLFPQRLSLRPVAGSAAVL